MISFLTCPAFFLCEEAVSTVCDCMCKETEKLCLCLCVHERVNRFMLDGLPGDNGTRDSEFGLAGQNMNPYKNFLASLGECACDQLLQFLHSLFMEMIIFLIRSWSCSFSLLSIPQFWVDASPPMHGTKDCESSLGENQIF